MPFEKGKSGNPNGRPQSKKAFSSMLQIAINEAASDPDKSKLRAVADALVTKALEGDIAAIREVADRMEGKVAQQVEMGGKDGGPIEFKTVYEATKD